MGQESFFFDGVHDRGDGDGEEDGDRSCDQAAGMEFCLRAFQELFALFFCLCCVDASDRDIRV